MWYAAEACHSQDMSCALYGPRELFITPSSRNTNTGVKGHEKCIMELLPRLVDDVWPNITPTDHQICSGNMHRDSCYMHQSEVSGKTTWPVSCCMHATWFPPLCCTLISNVALGVTSSSHREIVRHS